MADLNAALVEQFLNVSVTQRKAVVQPNRVLDDAGWESVAVGLDVGHGGSAYPGLVKATQPLKALVERAQTDVAQEFEGRRVEWQVGELPQANGDWDSLQQVMTNLLSNAVKYSWGREAAVIEVWAEECPGEWLVSVRDNGAGFNPEYAQKLFGAFQRLHSQAEFEGTGVGLATVRRIILRHGGTVDASSTLGQGATFSFTLPKTEA